MAEKTVSVDIEEALHRKARTEAAKQGLPVKQIYSEGLAVILEGSGGVGYPYLEANRELHEKLERILNSGDDVTIAAVVPNIEVFFERLRVQPRKKKSING